ncbi:MAG: WbqC family protein [Rikenellaceae bacterium]
MIILPTTYCGSIRYYSKLVNFDTIVDHNENYCKQSLRNRCQILGANGVINLIVPVLKEGGGRRLTKDIRIDNSKSWQHEHWLSIVSAYGSSPYFMHFSELFEPIYRGPYKFLVDLNEDLHTAASKSLGIDLSLKLAPKYIEASPEDTDLRLSMSTKPRLQRPDPDFTPPHYFQVFSEKMPFVEDLSILDLIFCEGRAGVELLRQSAGL